MKKSVTLIKMVLTAIPTATLTPINNLKECKIKPKGNLRSNKP
jgi:hypothetical protein